VESALGFGSARFLPVNRIHFTRKRARRMTGFLALAALVWTTLVPTQGQAQNPDEIVKRGKVVIAIDTTTPPYAFMDANNQPTGIDVEVANLIGKNLKVPVEFVIVNSPGRIPALLSNRVDMVVAVFSITAERALQVSFSIPYAGQSAVLIAPKTANIKGPDDLKGLKIGLTRGALEDGAWTAINPTAPRCSASTMALPWCRLYSPVRSTPWAVGIMARFTSARAPRARSMSRSSRSARRISALASGVETRSCCNG
jgi:hypothetical protein